MKFSHIIKKNLLYNIKKYKSNFWVNVLSVSLIFLLTSLLITTMSSTSLDTLYEAVNISLFAIIGFTALFISYMNVSFLKYRGKEFGMYITLGMTTKDLLKILMVENLAILFSSLIGGLIIASVFSHLFYLALNQMLPYNPIDFTISIASYCITTFVFIFIYFCNYLFTRYFIKKTSVIDIVKAGRKKQLKKHSYLLGVISFLLFIIALIGLPYVVNDAVMMACITALLVCPYFITGTMIVMVKDIVKRHKKTYYNQLLVLTNVSHRFAAYRNTLYLVSIFIAGAVFFIGFSYSTHIAFDTRVKDNNPYDLMYVQSNRINSLNQNAVKKILNEKQGKINEYNKLEFIETAAIERTSYGYELQNRQATIVSVSNYNKHMKTNFSLSENKMIVATNYKSDAHAINYKELLLLPASKDQFHDLDNAINHTFTSDYERETVITNLLENTMYVKYRENQIESISQPFANIWFSNEYSTGSAYIIDDLSYKKLKAAVDENSIKTLHLIKGKIPEKNFNALLNELKAFNNFDDSYWKTGSLHSSNSIDSRSTMENYRPIYKQEQIGLTNEATGSQFFVMSFISILFMLASGAVLYYKVLSDIDLEKDRILALKRIGITSKEIKSLISKELAIIFFVPLLFGMSIGIYLSLLDYIKTPMFENVVLQLCFFWLVFIVIQMYLYYLSRKRYLFEIKA